MDFFNSEFEVNLGVNGKNRMEGLVCRSNYGGKAAYIHRNLRVLAGV